jgi:hypothetical protein
MSNMSVFLCFLYFFDFMLPWYVANVLPKWPGNDSSYPLYYWYHFCFYIIVIIIFVIVVIIIIIVIAAAAVVVVVVVVVVAVVSVVVVLVVVVVVVVIEIANHITAFSPLGIVLHWMYRSHYQRLQ